MDNVKLIKNRLAELEEKSLKSGIAMYSKFLNPAEYMCLSNNKNAKLFGGYEDAIYKVAAFSAEEAADDMFPISAIKIIPYEKGKLNHRDYLGSILALGIERNVTGDIIVTDDFAVLYCLESVADFIMQNLKSVGRISVKTAETTLSSAAANVRFKEICAFVPSERLDNILSAAAGVSRTNAVKMLKEGCVKLNYTDESKADRRVNEKDIISVRGIGKFIYDGISGTSKKDRLKINIRKYI